MIFRLIYMSCRENSPLIAALAIGVKLGMSLAYAEYPGQSTTSAPIIPLTNPMNSLIATPIAAPKPQFTQARGKKLTEKEWMNEGLAASSANHFKEAIRIFEYLTSLQPAKGLYWFNLGNSIYLSGEPIRAVPAYQKVIALKSPLAPVAWLYIAKAQRESKSYDDALQAINSLRGVNLPPNLARELADEVATLQNDMSVKALEAYRANHFSVCIHLVDAAATLGPSPQLDTLRGMAQYQLGESEAAKRSFQLVYYGASDESDRREARDLFFATSPAVQGNSPSTLYADISAGYNSNVYTSGSSESGTQAAITSARISYNHGPAAVNFSIDEALGVPEVDTMRTAGQWTFLMKREKWTAVLIPEISLELNQDQLYVARYGFGLGIEAAGNHAWGTYFEVTRTLPLATDSAYLLGLTAIEKIYWTRKRATSTLSAAMVFQEDFVNDQNAIIGIIPLAGQSVGPALTGSFSVASRWELSGFSSYIFHNYNLSRFDRQFALGTRLSYDLGKGTRATFSSQFIQNGSTLGSSSVEDRNYVQWISQTGFTWELL